MQCPRAALIGGVRTPEGLRCGEGRLVRKEAAVLASWSDG